MPFVLDFTEHRGLLTVDVRRPMCRLYWLLQHILGVGRKCTKTPDMPFVLFFTAHPALEVPKTPVRPMFSCMHEGGGGAGGRKLGVIFRYSILLIKCANEIGRSANSYGVDSIDSAFLHSKQIKCLSQEPTCWKKQYNGMSVFANATSPTRRLWQGRVGGVGAKSCIRGIFKLVPRKTFRCGAESVTCLQNG